jgi:3-oxoacyl-[acyl-carrier-protein] synthase-3
MAALAARMALKRAGLTTDDIGLVVSGSSIPGHTTPAEAATVAAALEIEVPCFDLNSACTTFGMQMHFVGMMTADKLPPFVLMVQPEAITRVIDYSDRSQAVLFGDGTTAVVVSASVKARVALVDSNCGTKASAWEKVTVPTGAHFRQDGHAVQGFAIRRMTESVQDLKAGLAEGQRFRFIGHQANFGALQTVCERAEITGQDHWYNVNDFGNTGSSGAPAVLSEHWDELAPGDRLAICLVGAGLTWSNLLFSVEELR